jgi:hypothetical protein
MKHIWVLESSGGKSWRPSGYLSFPHTYYSKVTAKRHLARLQSVSPGLKWRVAKYERVK